MRFPQLGPHQGNLQNTHRARRMSSAARDCEWHQRLLITGRELDTRSLSIRPENLQQGACPGFGSLIVTQRMQAMPSLPGIGQCAPSNPNQFSHAQQRTVRRSTRFLQRHSHTKLGVAVTRVLHVHVGEARNS